MTFFYEKEATNIQKKRNFLKNRDLDLRNSFEGMMTKKKRKETTLKD